MCFEIRNQKMGKEQIQDSNFLKHSKPNLVTATGDDNLNEIFHQIKASKTPTVINYGASWCRVCSQILPAFSQLSTKFPKLSFVYADIDECPESTQHIRYTPTFHFYRDGERVDEMFGWCRRRTTARSPLASLVKKDMSTSSFLCRL